MTYENIIEKIENSRRFENLPGVEICKIIFEQLGNPQNDLQFIHVAGTNGKGSVCSFLQEIGKAAGYRVGMFTSPHLIEFEERIRVNGEMIAKADVERLGEMLLEHDFGVELTMFDYCMVMAILYFKEQDCDLVILETGLGGRLDSTNVIAAPLVSVITKIGYDHTAILGGTLPAIAQEKAGILKPGTHAVICNQSDEVNSVFEKVCSEQNIPVQFRGITNANVQRRDITDGQDFTYQGVTYHINMPGAYQMENAILAIEAARQLNHCQRSLNRKQKESRNKELQKQIQNTGESDQLQNQVKWQITDEQMQQGVAAASWAGRMQILCREPFLMADGAHNPNGVQALRDSLMQLFPGEKFVFCMAVMADKDYGEMVEMMLPIADSFITVTPDSSRALQGQALAELIAQRRMSVTSCVSVGEMIAAYRQQGIGKKTIAFGSLYFIGELLADINKF